MPNTYTQIYLQIIFATKGRDIKISSNVRDEIEKYICGIFNNKKQKVLAIYANPDHLHIFFSYKNLQITIPELVKTTKIESSNFINDNRLCLGKFNWQEGYGAFSYSKSQKDKVVNYVLNQEEHHKKKSFKEEYLALLIFFLRFFQVIKNLRCFHFFRIYIKNKHASFEIEIIIFFSIFQLKPFQQTICKINTNPIDL